MILVLLCFGKTYSQESEYAVPVFYSKIQEHAAKKFDSEEIKINGKNIDINNAIDNIALFSGKVNNQREIIKTDSIKRVENQPYLNYYGKTVPVKINFLKNATKFEYSDRLVCLFKIKSDNAFSLQVNFSKFNLPESAKFFVYNSEGMILGSFSNKNKIISKNSNNVFVTQPVKGSEIFLELDLENKEDLALVDIEINDIMHAFSNLYSSDGPFSGGDASTYTNCNKNVSCTNNVIAGSTYNTDINKGNMKSVGLMLNKNPLYGFTCSGTLINNARQDGTPYFLTAEHCIRSTPERPVFLDETLVIFNHETKSCTDNGNVVSGDLNSPSTNSVVGMQLLTSVGITQYSDGTYSSLSQDFALLKLNTTAEKLKKYRVCYSGWSNLQFPNNIGSSYTVHHPAGTVKKISVVNQSYITPINYSTLYGTTNYEHPSVYFSKSFSTNLTQGFFLAAEFADGFPYHGSSGAPLFNKDGFILGTLSTGPAYEALNETPVKPIHILYEQEFKSCGTDRSNKSKYNVLFSRFWRDYIFMQPWLNPESLNIQSVGNYCPAGIATWGSVDISNGSSTPQVCLQVENLTPDYFSNTYTDLKGYRVKPLSTFGQKIYIGESYLKDTKNYNIQSSENLITLDIDRCNNLYRMGNVYKVINNKLTKIEPIDIVMKNAVYYNGNIPAYYGNIFGVTNNKVFVFFNQIFDTNNKYAKLELKTYNTDSNSLVEESTYDIFPDWTTFGSLYTLASNFESIKPIFINENCIYLIMQGKTTTYVLRLKRSSLNSPWTQENFTFPDFFTQKRTRIIKTLGNLLFVSIQPYSGNEQLRIYNLDTQQTPTLLKTYLSNSNIEFVKDVNKISDNNFEIFYIKGDISNEQFIEKGVRVKRINLTNIIEEYDLPLTLPYFVYKSFSVSKNNLVVGSYYNSNSLLSFYRDQITGKWVKSTYSLKLNASMSSNNNLSQDIYPAFTYLSDHFFINDISWDVQYYSNSGNYRNTLFSALNVINTSDLKEFANNGDYQDSGAYALIDNLERSEWKQNVIGNKLVYDNKYLQDNWNWIKKISPARKESWQTYPLADELPMYNSRVYILSDKTAKVSGGNKSFSLQAMNSIVMKPGFSISSENGIEFKAKTTSNSVYPESVTFYDMLHPDLGDYHTNFNRSIISETTQEPEYLPIYGEIIWNELLKSSENNKESIYVYPNPVEDLLYIKNLPVRTDYKIINSLGQIVDSGKITSNRLNVNKLISGIYILNINRINIKIIKK